MSTPFPEHQRGHSLAGPDRQEPVVKERAADVTEQKRWHCGDIRSQRQRSARALAQGFRVRLNERERDYKRQGGF